MVIRLTVKNSNFQVAKASKKQRFYDFNIKIFMAIICVGNESGVL